MAKYETVLEETAEMLARKQLGLDPKKKDVEKDKDLPQIAISVIVIAPLLQITKSAIFINSSIL